MDETFEDPCGDYLARIGKRRSNGPRRDCLLPYRTDEIDSFFVGGRETTIARGNMPRAITVGTAGFEPTTP